MAEKLLTVAEVCEQLGVHRNTVYAWTNEGRLPVVSMGKPGCRAVLRWRERDVVRFIHIHRTEAKAVG